MIVTVTRMRNFFKTVCKHLFEQAEKSILKFLLEILSIIGALSGFAGMLYQLNALSFGDLTFFSFTQVINDGVIIFPVLSAILFGGVVGFWFLSLAGRYSHFMRNDVSYVIVVLLSIILFSKCFFLFFAFGKTIQGNIPSYGFILILYFLWTLSTVLGLHIFHVSIKACLRKDGGLMRLDEWLKHTSMPLIVLLISFFLLFSYELIDEFSRILNKHHCVKFDQQIIEIDYLNDKYVFATGGLILENKGLVFYKDRDCSKENVTYYIKRSSECLKVDGMDKDFIRISKIGLVRNLGFDFYSNRYCKESP